MSRQQGFPAEALTALATLCPHLTPAFVVEPLRVLHQARGLGAAELCGAAAEVALHVMGSRSLHASLTRLEAALAPRAGPLDTGALLPMFVAVMRHDGVTHSELTEAGDVVRAAQDLSHVSESSDLTAVVPVLRALVEATATFERAERQTTQALADVAQRQGCALGITSSLCTSARSPRALCFERLRAVTPTHWRWSPGWVSLSRSRSLWMQRPPRLVPNRTRYPLRGPKPPLRRPPSSHRPRPSLVRARMLLPVAQRSRTDEAPIVDKPADCALRARAAAALASLKLPGHLFSGITHCFCASCFAGEPVAESGKPPARAGVPVGCAQPVAPPQLFLTQRSDGCVLDCEPRTAPPTSFMTASWPTRWARTTSVRCAEYALQVESLVSLVCAGGDLRVLESKDGTRNGAGVISPSPVFVEKVVGHMYKRAADAALFALQVKLQPGSYAVGAPSVCGHKHEHASHSRIVRRRRCACVGPVHLRRLTPFSTRMHSSGAL
jgi:hypothetical protein